MRRVEHRDDVDVVVQVAADAGQVDPRRDAVAAQVLARADAREHQDLRRLQRARRRRRPRAGREPSAARRRSRASTATARRPSSSTRVVCAPVTTTRFGRSRFGLEVGLGGAAALAVLLRHLVQAGAFLAARR